MPREAVSGLKEIPVAFSLQRQKSKALVEVALDGARVHRELRGQRLGLQPVVLVELEQDLGQQVGERVVKGRRGGHKGHVSGSNEPYTCDLLFLSFYLKRLAGQAVSF